jgi:Holliday junction resolvase RusA-like endonuclease
MGKDEEDPAMTSRNPTEDDLKQYEANMKRIKVGGDGVSERGSSRKVGSNPGPPPHRQTFFVATILPNLNDMLAAARSRVGKWQRYDEEKQLYQSMIRADIKAANLTPMGRVRVHFLWHEKNKRRDKDNICAAQKYIFDALVEQQILQNDGWAEIASIQHEWIVCPSAPGCRVTMEEA